MTNRNDVPEDLQASVALIGNPEAAIFSRMAVGPDKGKETNPAPSSNTQEGNVKNNEDTSKGTATPQHQPNETRHYNDIISPGRFDDFYRLEKRLQNGTYGIVYEASTINKASEKWAVKVIDRTKLKAKDDGAVFREVAILKELIDVENVILLKNFFVSPATLYVVLALATGGDVFDRLVQRKTYTEQFARDLAKVLLTTVDEIHSRKIIHRDIKPGNLLLKDESDDCSILVADFGFAQHLNSEGFCKTRCGTPSYVAPEVILEVPYDTKIDMHSVGCVIYMLICGYPPFQGNNHRELFRKIRAGNFTFHETAWGDVSTPAKQLIAHLLTVNPKHRYSAQQALKSTWMQPSMPQYLSQNDLSGALDRIKARRKLKAAMDAVRWAASARFWNPDTVTFSQQMKAWDKEVAEKAEQQQQQPVSAASSMSSTSTAPARPKPLVPPRMVTFHERYKLLRRVRKGDYCTVWKCQHANTVDVYAVKIIPRQCLSTIHDEMVLNEVSILQSVSGQDNIVSLVDFYEQEDSFYIVMELLTGGDVYDRLVQRTSYTEREARDLMRRLLVALQALHKKGIAHRDVKPQNLLLKVSLTTVALEC